MSKCPQRLSVFLLCTFGLPPAVQAGDGVIHFQGAIFESASCRPQLQAGIVLVECDAERARRAGKPDDRFRLGAQHVKTEIQTVTLKVARPGQKSSHGYIIFLSYF